MAILPVMAPENLPFQLHLLVQSLTRKMHGVLSEFDLTVLHWGILCCLWTEDGQATQAISNRLDQLGGTITVGLDAMERRDLVKRKVDKEDHRVSRVFLTEAGCQLEGEVVPRVRDLLGIIFASTSPREYNALSRSVLKLRTHLSEI